MDIQESLDRWTFLSHGSPATGIIDIPESICRDVFFYFVTVTWYNGDSEEDDEMMIRTVTAGQTALMYKPGAVRVNQQALRVSQTAMTDSSRCG